jgi:hypothetical protein
MGHKCHDKNKSLQCNIDKLADRLFQPVSEPVKVTRDAFNVPTITGGTFQEMWRTFGYESARDKLWIIYFFIKFVSGQSATLFGGFPSLIDSDVYYKSQLPSDADLVNQFNNMNIVTRTQFESILEGYNQRIDDVNNGVPGAPLPAEFEALGITVIPHIGVAEFVASAIGSSRDLSSGISQFFNQLDMLFYLETLVDAGKSVNEGLTILSDVYNTTRRRGHGTISESAATDPLPCDDQYTMSTTKKITTLDRSTQKSVKTSSLHAQTTTEFLKRCRGLHELKEKMTKLKDLKGHRKNVTTENVTTENVTTENVTAEQESEQRLRSWGLSISGKHTLSGKPLGNSGPQAFLYLVPTFWFQFNLINETLGLVISGAYSPDWMPLFANAHSNNGYTMCRSGQVGTLPGTPALLETPNEDIPSHEAVIEVPGEDDIVFTVYTSPHKGFVLQGYDGSSVNRIVITSSLFEGEKSLVYRNLSINQELDPIETWNLLYYVSSFEEYVDTVRGPGWGPILSLTTNGHDNRCNIFGSDTVGWYDYKAAGASDLIPQGILGNPIPNESQVPLKTGYVIKNPKQGFVTNWNTPMTQTLPSVLGHAEYSRVAWIEDHIKELIQKGPITSMDNRNILFKIANGVNGAANLATFTRQNFNTPAFVPLFKKRFFDAVGQYPTPDRLAAVALLSDFDGSWIEGDQFDVINSLDISDKWILAQQWFFYVQQRIMEPTFGAAWSSWFSSNKNATRGYFYGIWIQSLISRLLGTSPVNNPIHYPNWLTPIPDMDQLIVDALDEALAFLGPRPWGVGQRPLISYENDIFGPLSFDGQDTPSTHKATYYFLSEAGKKGSVNVKCVNGFGQSSLTLFEGEEAVPQDTLQSRAYLNYEPLQRLTIENPKCYKCCKKFHKHHHH